VAREEGLVSLRGGVAERSWTSSIAPKILTRLCICLVRSSDCAVDSLRYMSSGDEIEVTLPFDWMDSVDAVGASLCDALDTGLLEGRGFVKSYLW
jgi:hypothetical protein